MEKWKQILRDRLWRNISRLGCSPERRAALLEAEWQAAVDATESGRPLDGRDVTAPVIDESEENAGDTPEQGDTAGRARRRREWGAQQAQAIGRKG